MQQCRRQSLPVHLFRRRRTVSVDARPRNNAGELVRLRRAPGTTNARQRDGRTIGGGTISSAYQTLTSDAEEWPPREPFLIWVQPLAEHFSSWSPLIYPFSIASSRRGRLARNYSSDIERAHARVAACYREVGLLQLFFLPLPSSCTLSASSSLDSVL